MRDNLRKIWFVLIRQLSDSVGSKRVWMGYLIGIVTAMKTSYLYSGYAGGRVVNILEPYLMNFMTFGDITMMLIGYILIIADAPFINCQSIIAVYRTTRKNWFWSMSLYVVVQGFLYYVLSMICSIALVMKIGYIQNQWSRPMKNLVLFPSNEAIEVYHMASPNKILLERFQPMQASVHTILLIFLYSTILGMILFVINASISRAVGTIVVGIIHVTGFMMMDSFTMPFLVRASLLANAEFVQHLENNIELFFSYCLMLLLLCILFFIGPILLKFADFKDSIGGWNE